MCAACALACLSHGTKPSPRSTKPERLGNSLLKQRKSNLQWWVRIVLYCLLGIFPWQPQLWPKVYSTDRSFIISMEAKKMEEGAVAQQRLVWSRLEPQWPISCIKTDWGWCAQGVAGSLIFKDPTHVKSWIGIDPQFGQFYTASHTTLDLEMIMFCLEPVFLRKDQNLYINPICIYNPLLKP